MSTHRAQVRVEARAAVRRAAAADARAQAVPREYPSVPSVPPASYRQCALPSCRRVASEAGRRWRSAHLGGLRMRGTTRPLAGATDTSASPGHVCRVARSEAKRSGGARRTGCAGPLQVLRGLNDPFTGGLSSYGLILMVPPPQPSTQRTPPSSFFHVSSFACSPAASRHDVCRCAAAHGSRWLHRDSSAPPGDTDGQWLGLAVHSARLRIAGCVGA